MLVREYRTRLRDILAEMNPEEANAIADLLLCAALETDRGTMLSVLDEEMSEEEELEGDEEPDINDPFYSFDGMKF